MALALGCTALDAVAADFDGSRGLLCAPSEVVQCDPTGTCDRVALVEVDLPRFLRVDFGKKQLAEVGGGARTSAIQNVQIVDGQTITQGAERGRAWSLVVDQDSGEFSGSIADRDGAFAVFGACTPL